MWSSHRYIARTSLSCNDASQTGLCTSLDHHWILYRLSIPSQWIQWISAGSCALCQQWFQLSSDSWSGAWADGRSHFSCAALGFQWVLRWSSAFGVVFSVDLWMLRYPNAKRPQSAVNWCWCPESRVQRLRPKSHHFDGQKNAGNLGPEFSRFCWGGIATANRAFTGEMSSAMESMPAISSAGARDEKLSRHWCDAKWIIMIFDP